MKVKNYTSSVRCEQSIAEIEALLARAGATNISKSYRDGEASGIMFQVLHPQPLIFKLPAKVETVEKLFLASVKRTPTAASKRRIHEQAKRTAWRLIRDWVDVQMSMVALEQAEVAQVFLPYVWNAATDETFFDRLKGGGFKQLGS